MRHFLCLALAITHLAGGMMLAPAEAALIPPSGGPQRRPPLFPGTG